jgi:hypothetical protein
MLGSKDYKEAMYFIYAEQMSMELQLKLKPYKKRKLPSKFAITIIKYTVKFINGSI